MSLSKTLRQLYIGSTNLTHAYQDRPSKILTLYKYWAPVYNLTIRLDPAYQRNLKKMIDMTVHPEDITLDIGCGTGLSTVPAAAIAKQVTGIDFSPNMLKKLQRRINKESIENITIIAGKYPENMPAKSKFDSIISSFTIVHWPQALRREVYKNIFHHLNPGGRLGLFTAQDKEAPSFATKNEIQTQLHQTGFENIEILDIDDIYRIITASKPITQN